MSDPAVSIRKCSVEGCDNAAHARGYCNTHYGQMWRKGEISPVLQYRIKRSDEAKLKHGPKSKYDAARIAAELERLNNLLRRAREVYNVAVGHPCRLRWRREIESLESEIRKLEAQHA